MPSERGVTTSSTGLQYEVVTVGTGPAPTRDDRVRVHYRGTLISGQEFDDTYVRGEPTDFAMSQFIPGWIEALEMMSPGSVYRLVVPPSLAYGDDGMGRFVEPGATIVYEIELVEVLR